MPCDGNEANRFACLTEGGLTCIKCEFYHPLNGNDMVAAMEKMVEKGDWMDFFRYAYKHLNGILYELDEGLVAEIMQPARFFSLMTQWLEVKDELGQN